MNQTHTSIALNSTTMSHNLYGRTVKALWKKLYPYYLRKASISCCGQFNPKWCYYQCIWLISRGREYITLITGDSSYFLSWPPGRVSGVFYRSWIVLWSSNAQKIPAIVFSLTTKRSQPVSYKQWRWRKVCLFVISIFFLNIIRHLPEETRILMSALDLAEESSITTNTIRMLIYLWTLGAPKMMKKQQTKDDRLERDLGRWRWC